MSKREKNQGYSSSTYSSITGFDSDWRDTWWSQDFLTLLARRLEFGDARRLLDVGCGAGHWGQRLSTLLGEGAEVVGIDHEPAFLEAARERSRGRPHRFEYREATAEALPLPNDSFDLVTCQTVLMHVADPAPVLAEMVRVTRPGGLVLAAEPNNLANVLSLRVATPGVEPETIDRLFVFAHHILLGKRIEGQGDSAVGERLPFYFVAAGLEGVKVCLNERCAPLLPPYETASERSNLAMLRQWLGAGISAWGDRETSRRLYRTGGGDPTLFDELFDLSVNAQRMMLEAVDAGAYYGAGGFMMYVVSGRKGG